MCAKGFAVDVWRRGGQATPFVAIMWEVILFMILLGLMIGCLIYFSNKTQTQSEFFRDAVSQSYNMQLPEKEIDEFYDLKEKLYTKWQSCVESGDPAAEALGLVAEDFEGDVWSRKIPQQEKMPLKQVLMRRFVKDIDLLSKVQKEKPGNDKLWRLKLLSETYYDSLVDAEKRLGQEVDQCVEEGDALEPGWREVIFNQAVHIWRMEQRAIWEKKDAKKQVVQAKKKAVQEEKKKVEDVKKEEEAAKKAERDAQKAMERLLLEEERASAGKKAKAKAKERTAAPNSGSAKKKR